MELLMIRHSSTRGNLLRQYVGSQDHPLAPEGVALAERRRGEMPPIDGLWVSPMLRCRQTAEILFPGVEQRLVDALKECDFGTFEGKTWAELKDNPIYQAGLAGDPHIAFPGGEVLGEHIARCRRGVAHVVEQARALGMSRPGILAHGGTLMSAMSGFAVPHQDFYSWLPSNCGGYLVRVEEGKELAFTLLETL